MANDRDDDNDEEIQEDEEQPAKRSRMNQSTRLNKPVKARNNGKQSSESVSGPSSIKKRVPATKGVNAALQAFEASFGISPSPAGKSSKASTPVRSARPTAGPSAFKSSFDTARPSTSSKQTRPSHHQQSSRDDEFTTPRKPNRTVDSPLLKPPTSHSSLLKTSGLRPDAATIAKPDKGKQRAVEPDSEVNNDGPGAVEDVKPEVGALSSLKQHGYKLAQAAEDLAPGSNKKRPRIGSEYPGHGDVKPLHALASTSIAVNAENGTMSTGIAGTGDVKPKWAALQPTQNTEEQDIMELLSPRKKRKGWVAAGLAERAAQLIKRAQTSHNLWLHELSRLLEPSRHSPSKQRSATPLIGISSSSSRTLEQLTIDANPQLRLKVIKILSGKPASLTWSGTEGGFITAGAAEKLLICHCRILRDEESSSGQSPSQSQGENVSLGTMGEEAELEGLVIFSMTCHAKSSSSAALARPLQREKDKPIPVNEDGRGQSTLNYSTMSRTLLLPTNIADLHSMVQEEEEVWAWDPWSIVDLKAGEGEDGKKALLISRFAVLQ